MPYHCLVPLAAALANLVIGALVLRQGAREPLHRVFAALTLAVVLAGALTLKCVAAAAVTVTVALPLIEGLPLSVAVRVLDPAA